MFQFHYSYDDDEDDNDDHDDHDVGDKGDYDDNDNDDEDDLGQDANDRSLSGVDAGQNKSKTCDDHRKHVGFL